MSFKEQLDSIRSKIKAKIKPESSKEELDEYNGLLGDLDTIETDYNSLSQENAKFKDKIVNMVLNEGDDKTPPDDSSGSKPKSMEQFINDFEKEHKEEK